MPPCLLSKKEKKKKGHCKVVESANSNAEEKVKMSELKPRKHS